MITSIIAAFVLGYLLIAFEHPLKLNKTIPALIMAAVLWALISIGNLEVFSGVDENGLVTGMFDSVMLHHLGKTSEILMFLVGAMTIVEMVALHKGFEMVKKWVRTKDKTKLLWILSALAFILSAIIDNLTATIVLVNILRKLIPDREERIWYASLIVVAANAGGAWSPIGDVTTTMLWIGDKVSTLALIDHLLLPSIVCMVIPVIATSRLSIMKGDITGAEAVQDAQLISTSRFMFFFGMASIVMVPVYKVFLNLPPYLGMMLSLAIVWTVSGFLRQPKKNKEIDDSGDIALTKIDMPSILFFLGILMAVGALESLGMLHELAVYLDKTIPMVEITIMLLGVLSAIVDNVPLVAATMGMFHEPMDHRIWHYIAYSCGTGGSILIIGSAAGIAAMGLERIDFLWYMKKIAWLAFIGFLAGFAALWGLELLF